MSPCLSVVSSAAMGTEGRYLFDTVTSFPSDIYPPPLSYRSVQTVTNAFLKANQRGLQYHLDYEFQSITWTEKTLVVATGEGGEGTNELREGTEILL